MLSLLGLVLDHRMWSIVLPTFVYLLLYSILPHKVS
jgi:hypothetical protein